MPFDIKSVPDQSGRLAIVTGANAGLGREAAIGLARCGMNVVMACRDAERGGAARADILRNVPDGKLQVMTVDLASLQSVRTFATHFRDTHPKLDVLINNAGILIPPPGHSPEGFETQMAVNYFGHFVLTALLFDLMPDDAASRVVSLSSIAHKSARMDFDSLNGRNAPTGMAAYRQSKLACLMFALELHRRLRRAGRQTLSVAAHPGVSDTAIGRNLNPAMYLLMKYALGPFLTHEPEKAVEPVLVAALGAEVKSGMYLGPKGVMEMKGPTGTARMRPNARDEAAAARLWTLSESLTGQAFEI